MTDTEVIPQSHLAAELTQDAALLEIENLCLESEATWENQLHVEPMLTRSAVSFQANKGRAIYRWFKYKEGFSADLVEYFIDRFASEGDKLLDPFAGAGTALFSASSAGMESIGIELLPIGSKIIETKKLIDAELREGDIDRLRLWVQNRPWDKSEWRNQFNELRITRCAYSKETALSIEKYLAAIESENYIVRTVLFFVLLCVLESISFTRKDGQYLRWDYRSGRKQGAKIFDKGKILSFNEAILSKLSEVITDLGATDFPSGLFDIKKAGSSIGLCHDSCLNALPKMESASVDLIVTSPPYCNRYDYTRTYALELAMLGSSEEDVLRLRQEMLSCTVENKQKDLLRINDAWIYPIAVADRHHLLQTILKYLENQRELDLLNNTGIPRMVRGYFYEMSCVIAECARILKPGKFLIMVNDNVRYAGASIPVDIILSEFAEKHGFKIQNILVLPVGKGNSSQQMGKHGRTPLRKCVYVWQKQ